MNYIEKLIYDLVKGSPTLKFAIRNIYQMAFDMLPAPKNYFLREIDYREGYFFGFHDKSPFSNDDKYLLACHTNSPLRMSARDESLDVGLFDVSGKGKLGNYHFVARTCAWNFHKGCRLQWLKDGLLIYNDRDGESLKTVIADINGRVISELPYAIDTVSDKGDKATSFSYERLNVLMPGYGYEYCSDGGETGERSPESTGLFIIDLKSGKRELLYSLNELAKSVEGEDEADDGFHYVTHSEFSRDGRYVSFLHRWVGKDYRKRHSRLMIIDMETHLAKVLPTSGMVSHYIWTRENKIVAYCSVREGDSHVMFDIANDKYQLILLGQLNMDGHQSMVSDTVFVTDTYPNRRRMASLYLVDSLKNEMKRIAYVYSPKKYQTTDFHNHIACDLHPRVSESGKFVCFDSAFSGVRSICVMPL